MSSIKSVAEYDLKYREEVKFVRTELSKCGTEYPVMKITNMCLWQVAFEEKSK